jgi:hypothetical protein
MTLLETTSAAAVVKADLSANRGALRMVTTHLLLLKELRLRRCLRQNELCTLRGVGMTAPHTLHILAATAMLASELAISVTVDMRTTSTIVSMTMRGVIVVEKRREAKRALCLLNRRRSGRFGDSWRL